MYFCVYVGIFFFLSFSLRKSFPPFFQNLCNHGSFYYSSVYKHSMVQICWSTLELNSPTPFDTVKSALWALAYWVEREKRDLILSL